MVTRRLTFIICLLLLLCGSGGIVVLAQATATPTPTPTSPTLRPHGCGDTFNPCGALPWPALRFPTLALDTVTPIPTLPTVTPVPITNTWTPSPSASPTQTPGGPTLTPTPYWTEVYYDCFGSGPCLTALAETQTAMWPSLTAVLGSQTPGSIHDAGDLSGGLGALAETLAAQATNQFMIDDTPQGPAEIASQLGDKMGVFFGLARALSSANAYTYGVMAFLILAAAFTLVIIILTTITPIILGFAKFLITIWQAIKPF